MLDSEFKRNIDSARDVLVGKVPDPKAQIEQITTAMIYKFMDYMDRDNIELGAEPQFFIKEYERYSWSKLLDTKLSGEQRLDLYVQAITKLPVSPYLPELFRSIFKGTFLPFRDPYTLNLFLKEIDKFDCSNSENLGNAFEYLLSILGSQGDAGQFRTPRHIIDFIVSAVDPQKEDTILDPACGTAGFLISAYKHIIKHNSKNYKANDDSTIQVGVTATETILDSTERYIGEQLSPYEKSKLLANVTGYDISPDMVKLSLVNLYLHGFKKPQIFEYDTLSDDKRWDDDFDVILANPPFMSPKGGINPHKRFSIQANRSEVLFVDYIAEHLKIGGRAGIIVPEGIIFQASKAYKSLRKSLIDNWGLYAVVSLPSGVFQPYSGVKTSILFLDKNLAKQSQDILFIKVTSDGFDLGAQRRKIDNSDLPNALKIIKEWKLNKRLLDERIATTVPKAKIAEDGNYNLTAERYREVVDYSNVKWEVYELTEISEMYQPKTISKKNMIDDGAYPVYGANGIIGKYNKFNHEEPQLLVGCRGTCGSVNISKPYSWITGNAMVIKPKSKIVNKLFLFYLLSKSDFNYIISGSAQPQITRSNLSKYKVPIPPLEIQEEIVAEIEQYQKVIDGAKLVVDSYKPEIEVDPEWEMVELGDVCDVRDGTHDSPKYHTQGVPLITSKNLKRDYIDFTNVKYISEADYEKISKRSSVEKGDVLFAMIGTIGNPTLVLTDKKFSIKNTALFKFRDNNVLDNVYLKALLESKYTVDNLNIKSRGGTQKFVSLTDIRKFKIPLPSLSVQQEIVARIEQEQSYVDGCKKLIEIYEQKIKDKIGKVWGE